ncbi:MAG: UvrD-helicase domain-containing protein [Lachnospiraceae bacterium]|nr:UvrD-helicase domain-containing protein [Lachnospiraceae bacterium]
MYSDKYALLNEPQKEAVFHTEGPLLILAGAGAGKTRVLTHRIAYLIEEKNVPAYNILAITFTNKAANEMKERVQNLVDFGDSVWVATFHSTCVRILRRFIDRLGYDTDFTIYDTDDQKTVVRHVVKELNLDPKMYKERAMVAWISNCKTEMMTPKDMMNEAGSDYRMQQEARIYEGYEKTLKKNNALDFDDLLLKTVQLFEENEQVLSYWQDRFQYIMVDEYQDTNEVQFKFVWRLSKKHKNLCVVGDDDQSIYRFRGADIRNILEFESHFPGTKVVKLEQNYRSTTHILDAANAVIRNNRGRKEKHLWSDLGEGNPVHFRFYDSAYAEAEEVIRLITNRVRKGEAQYKDFAVLYRTNAQSRLFEERCLFGNIPYQIVGGVNFYQRAEIKDLIAYLKTIVSGKDDVATRRIINVPKRGIGDTTLDKVASYAADRGLSMMEALRYVNEIPGIDRARVKLSAFAHMIYEFREEAGVLPDGRISGEIVDFSELIRNVIEKTEYESTLDDLDEEKAEQKKENIEELISKAKDFQVNFEGEAEPTLIDFLEEIALVADIDAVSESDDKVLLMTLHSSKGLEFPTVFLVGCEDGLFPSYQSINSGDYMDIEEERRLCYVGITRAQKELFISGARVRTVNGDMMYNTVSRFIEEIPEEMLDQGGKGLFGKKEKKPSADHDFGYNGRYSDDYSERYSERYGSGYDRSSSYGSGFGSFGSSSGTSYGAAAKKKPFTPPKPASFGKTFEIQKASGLNYDVGDRVRHIKFGLGTVTEIVDGKKDFEVAVNFDEYGEKRMFASFAKLKRAEE